MEYEADNTEGEVYAPTVLNTPTTSPLCQICGENPKRYTCPGCEMKTCSVSCVKRHKVEFNCEGKRPICQFIPLETFTESHLRSDYCFLESVRRSTDTLKRESYRREFYRSSLPQRLQKLQREAGRRNITLKLLPKEMSRRRVNTTKYQPKEKKIYWRIEWWFEKEDVTLVSTRVPETESLINVLKSHFESNAKDKERLNVYLEKGLEKLMYFFQLRSKANQRIFLQLDPTKDFLNLFQGQTIIEFPMIHVALDPSNYPLAEIHDTTNEVPESTEATITKMNEQGGIERSDLEEGEVKIEQEVETEREAPQITDQMKSILGQFLQQDLRVRDEPNPE